MQHLFNTAAVHTLKTWYILYHIEQPVLFGCEYIIHPWKVFVNSNLENIWQISICYCVQYLTTWKGLILGGFCAVCGFSSYYRPLIVPPSGQHPPRGKRPPRSTGCLTVLAEKLQKRVSNILDNTRLIDYTRHTISRERVVNGDITILDLQKVRCDVGECGSAVQYADQKGRNVVWR